MTSNQLLTELHEILLQDYDVDLRKEQVEEIGNLLFKFFETLLYVDISKKDV